VSDFPQDHPAPKGKCSVCWKDATNRDAQVAHVYRDACTVEQLCEPHSIECLEHDKQMGRTVAHEQRPENSPFKMLTLWFSY